MVFRWAFADENAYLVTVKRGRTFVYGKSRSYGNLRFDILARHHRTLKPIPFRFDNTTPKISQEYVLVWSWEVI